MGSKKNGWGKVPKANYGETPDGALVKMMLILFGIPLVFVILFLIYLWS